ncbi:MAG: protein phosphatase 2C domain-containing protein [Desulfococcaceae bacterium]
MIHSVKIKTVSVPAGSENQDQVSVFTRSGGLLLVLADGAGGSCGGGEAAEMAVRTVEESSECKLTDPDSWKHLLFHIDQKLLYYQRNGTGETTCLIVAVKDGFVCGAGAGNSEAWIFQNDKLIDLTENQHIKPLLGTGRALPVSFGPVPFSGTILAGTDGLFKYSQYGDILNALKIEDMEKCAEQLLANVRLPSGSFWDDVTFAICRREEEKTQSKRNPAGFIPEKLPNKLQERF